VGFWIWVEFLLMDHFQKILEIIGTQGSPTSLILKNFLSHSWSDMPGDQFNNCDNVVKCEICGSSFKYCTKYNILYDMEYSRLRIDDKFKMSCYDMIIKDII